MCILVKDALQLVKASLIAFRNQHQYNSILGLKFVIDTEEGKWCKDKILSSTYRFLLDITS